MMPRTVFCEGVVSGLKFLLASDDASQCIIFMLIGLYAQRDMPFERPSARFFKTWIESLTCLEKQNSFN
jgi:hypothetical protein